MRHSFGEKIKIARKAKSLTQKQLAEKIGSAHNSVSDWENDKNKPDPDTIELLCGILDITPNYLLSSSSDEFSPDDKLLIKKFHNLDPFGQETVTYILDRETARVQQLNEKKTNIITFESFKNEIPSRVISYYYKNASAGTGQVIIDNLPEQDLDIPDIPEYRNVSYAIGVNGSSMEPTYHDGDILLVEATRELQIGDIGIFQVDGQCYVKKLGETELISLNPEAKNIPLNESADIMGKVIGKLDK